jgi:hypothetical protein
MVDVDGVDEEDDLAATRVYRLADRQGVHDSVASFFYLSL